MSIVIGSACGSLLAVSPYDTLWRCRLNSLSKEQIQVLFDFVFLKVNIFMRKILLIFAICICNQETKHKL